MKRMLLLLIGCLLVCDFMGCLREQQQNNEVNSLSNSQPDEESAGAQQSQTDGDSLNESAIKKLLLRELFGSDSGWAEAKPSGINLYYGNQPDGIDKIVNAPIEDDAYNDGAGFYVEKDLTAIVFGGVGEDKTVTVQISTDMGNTWEKTAIDVSNKHGDFRYKYIGFTSDTDGYLVLISRGETDEFYVFLTCDGGKTWEETSHYSHEKDCLFTVSFCTRRIGFLAGQQGGDLLLLRTEDGGKTWNTVTITLPEDVVYDRGAFAQAPVFNGPDGILPIALLYTEGNAKNVYFATNDYGNTWVYWGREEDIPFDWESMNGS